MRAPGLRSLAGKDPRVRPELLRADSGAARRAGVEAPRGQGCPLTPVGPRAPVPVPWAGRRGAAARWGSAPWHGEPGPLCAPVCRRAPGEGSPGGASEPLGWASSGDELPEMRRAAGSGGREVLLASAGGVHGVAAAAGSGAAHSLAVCAPCAFCAARAK